MSTHTHRTAAALSATALALLVSACGGGDPKAASPGSDSPKPGSGASQHNTTEKPPNDAELRAMLVKPGQLKGFDVGDKSAGTIDLDKALKGDTSRFLTTTPAECLPLARMYAALPGTEPVGVVGTMGFSGVPEKKKAKDLDDGLDDALKALVDMRPSLISLSSYERNGAQAEVDSLAKAGKACAGGFSMKVSAEGRKALGSDSSSPDALRIDSVTRLPTKWGAAASAWTMKSDEASASTALTVIAVRKGPVLLKADTISIGLGGKARPGLEQDLIEAQVAKMR
ncbi:hypothetical protein QZN11_40425 [Streptomyces gramineus]|uniref:hypothetical protein n=1 Tax=Streptomyces gramineus TaxID=910542 RepID=UPI00398AC3A1